MDANARKAMENRFNVMGPMYEKAMRLYPNARTDAEEVLRLLNLRGSESVLEVTAGSGFLTMQMAERLRSGGGSIVAQDISEVMLGLSEKKARAKGLNNIRYYLELDLGLPIVQSGSIDKAACLGGFHHIEEPVKLLKTMARVLKPGGCFVVGDFADNSPVQRYFDECVHYCTPTGHRGLFLSVSQMVNFARFAGLSVSVERKIVPFIFRSHEEVKDFYYLVHGLEQDKNDTLRDIMNYMGVHCVDDYYIVPMDYVFAVYAK